MRYSAVATTTTITTPPTGANFQPFIGNRVKPTYPLRQVQRIRKQISSTLNRHTGGDQELQSEVQRSFSISKHGRLILLVHFKRILSSVSPFHTASQLRDFGFKFANGAFTNANKHAKQYGLGRNIRAEELLLLHLFETRWISILGLLLPFETKIICNLMGSLKIVSREVGYDRRLKLTLLLVKTNSQSLAELWQALSNLAQASRQDVKLKQRMVNATKIKLNIQSSSSSSSSSSTSSTEQYDEKTRISELKLLTVKQLKAINETWTFRSKALKGEIIDTIIKKEKEVIAEKMAMYHHHHDIFQINPEVDFLGPLCMYFGIPIDEYRLWREKAAARGETTLIAMGTGEFVPTTPYDNLTPRINHQHLEHHAVKTKLLVFHLTGDAPQQYHRYDLKSSSSSSREFQLPRDELQNDRYQELKQITSHLRNLLEKTKAAGMRANQFKVTRNQYGDIVGAIFLDVDDPFDTSIEYHNNIKKQNNPQILKLGLDGELY
ncbi:hypothetical protein DFA_10243 [Cavenderia fasciculata]|uniref:Uncharacterized protein n=1 Tax=Cavenderia fasciculata TaxID=261658 RepID=F4Q9N9_CACFS|nr:uncharacterized protein DFA_10243 [Cavenderia fasciculata]EGG15408.1 hypothetical protein DFA_10243 [Cavenderia fasciculata]|eukprot:XP_004354150.1 hypothetical protein DFA_10243 [Cavenderia fasciculata]